MPGRQAMRLRVGLIDYTSTTFALVDSDAQAALRELLEDESEGIFKGPYLRTMVPFSAAPRRAVSPLDRMPAGFAPYAHQAAAFRRLSSLNGRPQPTLVTTGTGSGKTEAFLYPRLHARRQGVVGREGVSLHPMNSLTES